MNRSDLIGKDELDILDDIEHWLDIRSPYALTCAFNEILKLVNPEIKCSSKEAIEEWECGKFGDKFIDVIKLVEASLHNVMPDTQFWKNLLLSKVIRLKMLAMEQNGKKLEPKEYEKEIDTIVANLYCLVKDICWSKKLNEKKDKNPNEQKIEIMNILVYLELSILFASPGVDDHELSLGCAIKAHKKAKNIKDETLHDHKDRMVITALYSQGLAYHHLHDENKAIEKFASEELDFRDLKYDCYKNSNNKNNLARKLYLQIYAQTQRADALIHSQRCFEAIWLLSNIKNGSVELFDPHKAVKDLANFNNREYYHLLTLVYMKLAEAALDMGLNDNAENNLGKALEAATNKKTVEKKIVDQREIDPSAVTEIYYQMARLKFERAKKNIEKLNFTENKDDINKLYEKIEEDLIKYKNVKLDDLVNQLENYGAAPLLVSGITMQDGIDGKYKFKLTKKRKSQIVQKLADVGLLIQNLDENNFLISKEEKKYIKKLKRKYIKILKNKLIKYIEELDLSKELNEILIQLYIFALREGRWDDEDALIGLCDVIKLELKNLEKKQKYKKSLMKNSSDDIFNMIERELKADCPLKKTETFTNRTLIILKESGVVDDSVCEKWENYTLNETLNDLISNTSLFRLVAYNIELKKNMKWNDRLRFLIAFLADNLRDRALKKEKTKTAKEAEDLFDEMLSCESWEKYCGITKGFYTRLNEERLFCDLDKKKETEKNKKNYNTLINRYVRPQNIEKRLLENNQNILNLLQGYSVDKSWYSEFSVLRRWNSYSPVLSRESRRSKGGGYFLQIRSELNKKKGKLSKPVTTGIVIDPGFDFLENFFNEGFAFLDIDVVLLTHAHHDHSEGLIPILNLPFQLEKQLRIKKPLLYLLSPGAYEKYHPILQDSSEHILDIVRLDPKDFEKEKEIDLSNILNQIMKDELSEKKGNSNRCKYNLNNKQLKLKIVPVKHSDLGGKETVGLKIYIPTQSDNLNQEMWFVYSSDTKWSQEIAEGLFEKKDNNKDHKEQQNPVICLNIGSIMDLKAKGREKEYETLECMIQEEALNESMSKCNHLYLSGVLLMLYHWAEVWNGRKNNKEDTSLLAIISEFGEEMYGGIRQITCEMLEEYIIEKVFNNSISIDKLICRPLRVLPADIGLRVELTENPRVFCEKCQGYVPLNCISVDSCGPEESLFYLCDACIKDNQKVQAFMENDRSRGKQFVWDLEKKR